MRIKKNTTSCKGCSVLKINGMKKILLLLLLLIITSCYKESFIPIEGDFTTSFVSGDESVPVIVKINSDVTGADTYAWEFEGGSPSASSKKNPGEILYTSQGTFVITLTMTNVDGESKKITKEVVVKEGIAIQFTSQIVQSNYSPVEVQISNTTPGEGLSFIWSFEGGNPAVFTGSTPPNVVFSTPGDHTISLTVSNGFESQTQTQTVNVAPNLISSFSYSPIFEDDDYQASVTVNFVNESVSATQYNWTFQGGNPAASTTDNPTVTFANEGVHQVTLVALNGKTSQSFSKTITVEPDTNLRIFRDVKIGINSAHATVGAMFSTATRLVYKAGDINAQNSALIDIAFQGLNSNFTYNKFISPSQVSNYGFLALANAQNTIFINSQELCSCGLNFTETQFDAMTNDVPLQSLNIVYNAAGNQEFGSSFPRIVLFKTQDGRKGAIKIKNKIQSGANSYILCDIKVQKQ
jgi:PKD repeat protein